MYSKLSPMRALSKPARSAGFLRHANLVLCSLHQSSFVTPYSVLPRRCAVSCERKFVYNKLEGGGWSESNCDSYFKCVIKYVRDSIQRLWSIIVFTMFLLLNRAPDATATAKKRDRCCQTPGALHLCIINT